MRFFPLMVHTVWRNFRSPTPPHTETQCPESGVNEVIAKSSKVVVPTTQVRNFLRLRMSFGAALVRSIKARTCHVPCVFENTIYKQQQLHTR